MNAIIVIGVLAFAGLSLGYPTGAPPSVCDSMFPGHGFDAQKGPSPYKVASTKTNLKPGERTQISIQGAFVPFKGFLIEVRDENDEAVGTFDIKPDDPYSKTIDCHSGIANTATHKSAASKESVTLDWIAPNKEGTLKILVTLVQKFDTFWVKEQRGTLTIV